MSASFHLPPPPSVAAAASGSSLAFSGGPPDGTPKRKLSVRAQLGQLCKEGRLELARRLFDTLPRPVPTVVWNTLLIGYVCNSLPMEALRLYALMDAAPDAYTFSSTLKACADERRLRAGESLHGRLLRLPRPGLLRNRVLNNSLLGMYAACSPESPRAAAAVRLLFDRMPKRNVVSWNTMLGWALKARRPLDSLKMFKKMVDGGTRPSAVSFVNVFPAVAAMEDWRNSMVLYGMLLRHGDEYVDDAIVTSSAICMFSELSDVSAARRAFDRSATRNTEVWNAMIGGYVQNDLPEDALDLFVQILAQDAVLADTVTLIAALMAASMLQNSTAPPPVILSNALMVMYSRCGSVQTALDLFHQMPEKDVVSWNTMASALVQNGLETEGSCSADAVTLTAALSAASNLGDIRTGREAHGYLIRHGIGGGAGMDSYLIDVYAKSGAVEIARRLFDMAGERREQDLVTWNAMIAGYAQAAQAEPAVALFRKMLLEEEDDDHLAPSAVTLSSVIPACGAAGGLRSGRENVFVGTSLVDMYAKCGCVDGAEKVFDGMREKNSVTYTTMISGLGAHGLGCRALSLFWEMQWRGMAPDAVTFVAAMTACGHSGMVEEGLELFHLMEEEFQIPASVEHHCCVVDMLGRAGRIKEAYDFARELGEDGGFVGIWGSLLAACRLHGELELGKRVAERLFEIERRAGGAAAAGVSGYHVLLSNVYAAEGSWEKVNGIRRRMRSRG
ncbi:unnamed protein product [Spirodela intermedia]|uniref:Uncharacterized protein n=1 Tax=Spirodela intermedia TaxID=51605 RepID=A0A7I8JH57_SPIIN|nr:unnamed protein product [Spirodela intermedia]CAA6669499.1 unnamed protein product [Spirodela intermedia]